MAAKRRTPANELPDDVVARIRASIAEWAPGLWAERVNYGPTCKCGMPEQALTNNPAFPSVKCQPDYVCSLHGTDTRDRPKGGT